MSKFINNFNNFEGANIGNFANQLSGNEQQRANQHNSPQTEAERFLVHARTEIYRLLDELDRAKPSATDLERITYISEQVAPEFMQQVTEVLKMAGKTYRDLFEH